MPAPTQVPHRSEIPEEHKWNDQALFASPAAWAQGLKEFEGVLQRASTFRGQLGEGPDKLVEWFEYLNETSRSGNQLAAYALMSHNCDTMDQDAAGMAGQIRSLLGKAFAVLAFADPEILQLGSEQIVRWLDVDSELATYRFYFDDLFRRQAHVGSPEVEQLLGALEAPFGSTNSTYNMLNNADLTFEPARDKNRESVSFNQGTYFAILNQDDRERRRTAWENYNDAYLAFKNTFASNLTTVIQQDVFTMRSRNYASSLEAALFPDNVPANVFHNLIQSFKENLPTWHRYFAFRKEALELEAQHPYDIWAPLSSQEPEVPYEQAVEWIVAGMAPLGEVYTEPLRRGCLEDRWVDRYPNLGKQQGAFSMGLPGIPPFIKMSYTGDIKSLSTLAHELGHSMHSYFSQRAQPIIFARYTLFSAEVASNFNQAMTRAYLLDNISDPAIQLGVIEEAMSNFHRYFLIMPTLARFELEMHERVENGEGLTADRMISRMAELFAEAYGPAMQIDNGRVGISWAQFGHLYRNFYVYKYATGIAGAHELAQRVSREGGPAVEAYLGFLRAGGSDYSLDLLRAAGVDLESPEPVEAAMRTMADYVDRLESILAG